MKKVILLSELTFNSCLTYATIRLWNWENYEIKVSFVPQANLNEIVPSAIEMYDLVIGIGYQATVLNSLAKKSQLVFLAHQEDEQGGKFFLVPSQQKMKPKTLKLIEKIKEIADQQIKSGIYFDLLRNLPRNKKNQNVIEYLNLQRRYFQALSVVKNFYGREEQIRLHNFFLLEIIDEPEDENVWIDELIARYNLAEDKHQKPARFAMELSSN